MYNNFVEFAKKVWSLLSDDQHMNYYCGTGTIGFVEDMARVYQPDLTDDQYEQAHDEIFGGNQQ